MGKGHFKFLLHSGEPEYKHPIPQSAFSEGLDPDPRGKEMILLYGEQFSGFKKSRLPVVCPVQTLPGGGHQTGGGVSLQKLCKILPGFGAVKIIMRDPFRDPDGADDIA